MCGLGSAPAARAEGVTIPNFWNPRARQERMETQPSARTVRFLTDDEFPPLHFAGPDGTPTGFVVELARAVCERLAMTCTVQARRFDTLLDALAERQGDVVAAAIPLTPALRARFLATRPYFRWPARFAARTDKGLPAPSAAALADRSVGVVGGTAHAAYLKAFFPKATAKDFTDLATAEGALRRGEVDYVFADGLNLALWIGGVDAGGLLRLHGRRLPREPLLRRGHRPRHPPRRPGPVAGPRRRAPAPVGRGEVRRAVPAVLPGEPVLRVRVRRHGGPALPTR